MRGPRLSIAGLMILVGIIALDCAILVYVDTLWDRSAAMAVCLLIDVLPLTTAVGIAVVLALRPPRSRTRGLRVMDGRGTLWEDGSASDR
jgi:hypothetical protein